jgi:two-component system, cell cycle response regulator CtrA
LNPLGSSEARNLIDTVWGGGYVLCEPHEAHERIPA